MKNSIIKENIDKEIEEKCREKAIEFSSVHLDESLNLLDSGIFDSLGVLELITKLEEELSVEVDLSEHSPEEFTQYCKLIEILESNCS